MFPLIYKLKHDLTLKNFNNDINKSACIIKKMKKIVCYGDSNTFGFNPKDASRYDERWTSILQQNLGKEYEVINEGMCNRTGFVINPDGFLFSGPKHFPQLISQSENIDFLILWIGTNDLMFQYNISFEAIENGLGKLIKQAQTKITKIIVIPPVILNENILKGYFKDKFDKTSITKSTKVGEIYKRLADTYHCDFFDVNKFVTPSDIDGLHYDRNSHKIIADKLTQLFKPNF